MGLLSFVKKMTLKEESIPTERHPISSSDIDIHSLDFSHIVDQFQNCEDLRIRHFKELDIQLIYFDNLVDKQILNEGILDWINKGNTNELHREIDSSGLKEITSNKQAVIDVLNGDVVLSFEDRLFSLQAGGAENRSIEESETESIILGPHDSFIESADVNISMIRKRLKSSHLKTINLSAGEITKTSITIMYLEDIAPKEELEYLKNRINDIEYSGILDTNILVQMIDDQPLSPFPQFFTTERPDVSASKLLSGKMVGIVDGSPYVFCAPVSFFDFFQSVDDYSQRWITGTFIRLLRMFAFVITVAFTAIYVSVTTFHYEMVPQELLPSLIESRSKVPFPPLIEAIFLELVIELLREAGARLPTKIGQTIGIVGGIVIGQAAVEAGITSNILIIAVAVSAISSFVIPSYVMSASIRIVRFSFILLAGFWGNMGLVFGLGLLVIHLTTLTSLKTPYMIPFSPTFFNDWLDTIIRAPYMFIKDRPEQIKTRNETINKMKK
ncbi:spore germination protein [Rossellomorea aquimaris]|uniref:spore germination protein n=1 Tax=Rossellomorea aquimaris TaxID=189382 RepID=UPI001CD31004|nr:spore germination protein [Rossellomorea aquimaris]MCA1058218.1 spore germination protein [Rossellomorea aquimaris]